MITDIKPYLKYYIGQKVLWAKSCVNVIIGCDFHLPECPMIHIRIGEYSSGTIPVFLTTDHAANNEPSIQLLLRPLSDMTNEEVIELVRFRHDITTDHKLEAPYFICYRYRYEFVKRKSFKSANIYFQQLSPAEFHYLLSKGFDLFGLIESGLAKNINEYNNGR